MGRTERLYKIEHMLRARKFVPIRDFLAELEVSSATFKRVLEYLRERSWVAIQRNLQNQI